jgi:hypothetical protein
MSKVGIQSQAEGAVKPSFLEVDGYEPLVSAHRHVEIPSNLQAQWVYDGNGNCTYAGYAPKGLATNQTGWLLHKFTISSGLTTARQIAYDSWDNYATASYS